MEASILYLLGCIMACTLDYRDKDEKILFIILWPTIIAIFTLIYLMFGSYNWVRNGKFDPEFEE